ncbi:MAG TPA: molybdopterin dinucleotide binding domain-containing protein [Longimicrobiaceae bacterium]|nr:molybdopterin dinucleotide binding domain-containing protein [Longimicrobiaceae bacterium]
MSEVTKNGIERRDFLKVLGVGTAGAATVGCSTGDVERLIPYVVPAEEIVPGLPTWYASTCRECPAGCGIHVETHSGRVTKVEGNPDQPISRGNLCARGQASVQGLYHPDRFQGPQIIEPGVRRLDVSWSVAENQVADKIRELRQTGGGEVVLLTPAYTGTMERLANDWVAAVGARRVVYEPFAQQPRGLNFADADLLISFGADFLETWGSPVDYAWQFAQMRDHRIGTRGKFVWVGPHRPLTGINADQWIAPRPGTESVLAMAIGGTADAARAARETGVGQAIIEKLQQEYASATKPVVLGPGAGYTTRDSRALKSAIDALNAPVAAADVPTAPPTGSRDVMRLIEQMRAGSVGMVLIDGDINPAYTLPGEAKFAEAMERVPTRVSFSTYPDETALLATHLLPSHHFLEDWDDYSPQPEVNLLVQPAMRPVFNTKSRGDVLLSVASILGQPSVSAGVTANSYYDYLRENWRSMAPGQDWRDVVKAGGAWPATPADGVVPAGPGLEGVPREPITASAAVTATSFAAVEFEGAEDAEFNLVVYPSYRFFDGRTANRPWLLELPDPVTKVSWQSFVEIHPRTAREMGIEQGDVVRVTSPYGAVDTFAYVYPGVRPDTVAIQMGLGHEAFGRFTEGHGVNPNRLLGAQVDAGSGDLARYGVRVSISKLGDAEGELAQGLFEAGERSQNDREIARAISLAEVATLEALPHPVVPGAQEQISELRGNGGFTPIPSETDPASYPPPGTHYGEYVEGATRWAMAIDISRCIGCSACVTACYAENNIPVVGPSEVRRGRELSWLRIERYFKVGQDEEAAYEDDGTDDVRFLPMLCQHCGNAPCEPVCPVYAAYHTPDGLNGQVYNRCVGTRYCANNCPYKVRYFNWFTYDFIEPLNLQLNPDVAVREKGVMEKCTFCVQRIRETERKGQLENRPVRDGEIVPACVQTCPTEVFVFGNIADPDSQVAQAARSSRGYRALEVLNTQPAIVYLKKVTLGEPEHGGHAPAGEASHESIG